MPAHKTSYDPRTTDAPANTVLADNFKAAFRNHPAGVAVITAFSADGPVGLTASSVSSVSANPPLLVFSLSAYTKASPAIRNAETILVHLMRADQLELAKTFATGGIDRFADTSTWSRLVTGEPILHGAETWLRGEILSSIDVGNSTIVVVKVLEVGVPDETESETNRTPPLVYHNRAWHSLSEASELR